jgi:tetratricopeptide (TPR) repeat protein
MRGDFEEARSLAAAARQAYQELGLRLATAGLTQVTGPLELLAGDLEAAERELREGLEILEPLGSSGYQDGLLAAVAYRRGDVDEAERLVERAEAEAAEDNIAAQVAWRAVRAKLERSVELAEAAVELAGRTDALNLRGDAELDLAETLRLAGEPGEAARAAQRALELYEQKGNVVAAAQAASLLATSVR